MSMISSLIDELRKSADGQVTYRDAREVMLEAADTIWQLRDYLHLANEAVRDAKHDESCAWDRVRKAEVENTKLRELVKDYEHCSVHADCSRCEYDGKLSTHCPFSPCFPDTDELRNLGVEVEQ